MSTGVVSKLTSRAAMTGLDWATVERIEDDRTLEERLYGRDVPPSQPRPEPNPAEMHVELKKPGVTLELLHLEYLQAYPTGLKYTAFLRSLPSMEEAARRDDATGTQGWRESLR